jgi:hypothetical protein
MITTTDVPAEVWSLKWWGEVAPLSEAFFAFIMAGSAVVTALVVKDEADMSAKLRSGWSRLMMSLMSRTPEKIAWIKRLTNRRTNKG